MAQKFGVSAPLAPVSPPALVPSSSDSVGEDSPLIDKEISEGSDCDAAAVTTTMDMGEKESMPSSNGENRSVTSKKGTVQEVLLLLQNL